MVLSLDYEWDDTEETVNVLVRVKNVKKEKIDIYTTNCYLKVSAPPYFFQLDLFSYIDEDESKVLVREDGVEFQLKKLKSGLWDDIKSPLPKDEVERRRKSSIEQREKRERERSEKLAKERDKAEKLALEKQWELEKQRKETIELRKKIEREEAEGMLYSRSTDYETEEGDVNEEDHKSEVENVIWDEDEVKERNGEESDIFGVEDYVADSYERRVEEKVEQPLRSKKGAVKVVFTPREAPTPAREGKEDPLFPKKKEPEIDQESVWMKDRGDYFYRAGDFQAAINAYSAALLRERIGSVTKRKCFGNRAACYLRVGEFVKSIADCDAAIKELEDVNSSSATTWSERDQLSLQRLYCRLGAAKFMMGEIDEAKIQYEKAISFGPRTEDVLQDLKYIRSFLAHTAMPQTPKEEGDSLYKEGQFEEAIECYKTATLEDADPFICRSNIIACLLRMNHLQECVQECSSLLEDIQFGGHTSIVKYSSTLLRIHLRRGYANLHLGRLEDAYVDYEVASKMVPEDSEIRQDFHSINTQLRSKVKAAQLLNSAKWYKENGEIEKALSTVNQSIELYDFFVDAFILRAACNLYLEDKLKAKEDAKKAEKLMGVVGEEGEEETETEREKWREWKTQLTVILEEAGDS